MTTPSKRSMERGFEVFKLKRSVSKCVNWVGTFNSHGYGRIYISRKKSIMAHRAMYEGTYGKIPKDKVIDHMCRNTSCVNPKHMRVVTNRENVLCGIGPSAVNARKTECPSGHQYSGKNLVFDSRGARFCRACRVVQRKKYWNRLKLKGGEDV